MTGRPFFLLTGLYGIGVLLRGVPPAGVPLAAKVGVPALAGVPDPLTGVAARLISLPPSNKSSRFLFEAAFGAGLAVRCCCLIRRACISASWAFRMFSELSWLFLRF